MNFNPETLPATPQAIPTDISAWTLLDVIGARLEKDLGAALRAATSSPIDGYAVGTKIPEAPSLAIARLSGMATFPILFAHRSNVEISYLTLKKKQAKTTWVITWILPSCDGPTRERLTAFLGKGINSIINSTLTDRFAGFSKIDARKATVGAFELGGETSAIYPSITIEIEAEQEMGAGFDGTSEPYTGATFDSTISDGYTHIIAEYAV